MQPIAKGALEPRKAGWPTMIGFTILTLVAISSLIGSSMAGSSNSLKFSWTFHCQINTYKPASMQGGWVWYHNGTSLGGGNTRTCGPAKFLDKTYSGGGTRPAGANSLYLWLGACGSTNTTKSFAAGAHFNVTLTASCGGAGGIGHFSGSLSFTS